jgi:hypothetical protein
MKLNLIILPALFLLLPFSGILSAQDFDPSVHPPRLKAGPEIGVDYASATRKFTGIPSLAISPREQLWAVWYAGITPAEDDNNYVVVAKSGDKGESWQEVLVIDPDGPGQARAFDPQAWVDPDGQLWVFWAQHIYRDSTRNTSLWAVSTIDPDAAEPIWSTPRKVSNGVMMGKPVVLSNQEWALPVSFWHLKQGSAKIVVSSDRGKSWEVRGAVDVPENSRSHDEHAIVERKDGTLRMLVRTRYGIGESFSKDWGRTWSPLSPSAIQNPSARFFVRRLQSGNLLLVKNGPVGKQTKRSHLMAFISSDDGHSWSKGLLLYEKANVSYPDGQQAENGEIFLTFDYNRTKDKIIYMTSFSEEDILSSDYDVKLIDAYDRRKIISDGGDK